MWLIALNTYRWFRRKKIVNIFFFCSIVLFVLGSVLGGLALDESFKVMVDFSLMSIELLALILLLFYGTRLFEEERKQKTQELVHLSLKKKSSFVLWKYVWFAMVLAVFFLLMTVVFVIQYFWVGGNMTIFWWSLLSIFFVFVKMLVLLAIVFFFSVFVSPMLSLFVGLVIYFVAHALPFLKYYFFYMQDWSVLLKHITNILYYILPQMEQLSLKEYLFSPSIANWSAMSIGVGVLVHILYILVLLFLSVSIYNKQSKA